MFADLQAKVSDAGGVAAITMAHQYERAVKDNLGRMSHPKYTVTPSAPGNFPAQMYPTKDGGESLRQSVRSAGPTGWSAWVAPHVFYAAVQEYGHRMHAHGAGPMTWYNEGFWWSKRDVGVPARPYMAPTTIQEVASGDLTAAAMAAFETAVWG